MSMNSNAEKMAKEVKDKYGYDMVLETYVNANTKATFICSKHGAFQAYPGNVRRGRQHCKTCYPKQNYTAYYDRTFDDTQLRCPYEIVRETYRGIGYKATFICQEHGAFTARVQDVIGAQGQRCPVCVKESRRGKRAMPLAEAQAKCKYEIVEYGGTIFKPSILNCKEHGNFVIDLAHVIHRNQGCPVCGAIQRKQTNLERYGHIVPAQSKDEMGDRARKNHPTARRKEDEIYDLLREYTGLEFEREQRYTPERKYRADFMATIGTKTIIIEFHNDWVHGKKPYDPNDKECVELVEKWKALSNGHNYYATAIKQYTVIDPEKQAIALADNKYLFLPFYSKQEVIDAFTRELSKANIMLEPGHISRTANYFQFDEKYKHEIEWFNNSNANKLLLYANRYKHHNSHKRLAELSDIEIVNGIGAVAHFTPYYTGFSTKDLTEYVTKHNVKSVYDPFAGFGQRMLACAYAGVDYEGCEINPATYNGLCNMRDWLIAERGVKSKITLYNADGITHKPQDCDLVYTCPPYYDREIYSEQGLENMARAEFDRKFMELLVTLSGKCVRMVVAKDMLHLFDGWTQEPYLQRKSHYAHDSKNITEWVVDNALVLGGTL